MSAVVRRVDMSIMLFWTELQKFKRQQIVRHKTIVHVYEEEIVYKKKVNS